MTLMVDNQTALNTLGAVGLYAGAFGSFPISTRWSLDGKFLPGFTRYPRVTISGLRLGNRGGFGLHTGGASGSVFIRITLCA